MDKNIKFGCPFCGEEKENIEIDVFGNDKNKLVVIRCPECGAEIRSSSKGRAINAWNRRV